MKQALTKLLAFAEQELDERKTSGNAEETAALQQAVDDAHAALRQLQVDAQGEAVVTVEIVLLGGSVRRLDFSSRDWWHKLPVGTHKLYARPSEQAMAACDCENLEPISGAALVSMECPIHNENPRPHPGGDMP